MIRKLQDGIEAFLTGGDTGQPRERLNRERRRTPVVGPSPGRQRCPHAGLRPAALCGWHPVGQQEVHGDEVLWVLTKSTPSTPRPAWGFRYTKNRHGVDHAYFLSSIFSMFLQIVPIFCGTNFFFFLYPIYYLFLIIIGQLIFSIHQYN